MTRFDEDASRLIQFRDDKGSDLTLPPDSQKVNTFFSDNKPIQITLGPGKGEGEFLVRTFRLPAEGATTLHVEAELAFMVFRDRKTAETKLDMSEGSETEAGPLRFRVVNPDHPPRQVGSGKTHYLQDLVTADGATTPTAKTHIAFQFEPSEDVIGSVEWLGPDETVLSKVDGSSFARPFTYFRQRSGPKPNRIRVTSFDSAERVILPITFDVRLGLR